MESMSGVRNFPNTVTDGGGVRNLRMDDKCSVSVNSRQKKLRVVNQNRKRTFFQFHTIFEPTLEFET